MTDYQILTIKESLVIIIYDHIYPSPIIVLLAADGQSLYPSIDGHFPLGATDFKPKIIRSIHNFDKLVFP